MAFVYSCCFWFSLRLGGIMIGIFSLLQGVLMLTVSIVAQAHSDHVQECIKNWIDNSELMYTKVYFENFHDDPDKYLTIIIMLSCVYIALCGLYIYGAYMFQNILLVGFILVEFLRLLAISTVVTIWLLVLKQNTMDIGLLIGASVAAGFALLGMFYLWACAANLPVVVNEIEHDEQAATIARLRQLLDNNHNRNYYNQSLDNLPESSPIDVINPFPSRDVFTIPNYKPKKGQNYVNKPIMRNPAPHNNYGHRYFRPSDFGAIRQ